MSKVQDIISDLKSSWYFRFWALLWVVFFILGFVALGILGNRSANTTMQKDGKIWWQNNKSMYLPRFHFHTGIGPNSPPGNEIINNISCSYNHQPVQTGVCQSYGGVVPDLFHCVAVYGDQIEVFESNSGRPDEMAELGIACNITVMGNITGMGTMIAFGLEGQDNYIAISDPHTALWIHPTTYSMIALTRERAKVHGNWATMWDRQLIYMSSVTNGTFFHIRTVVNGFSEFNYDVWNLYSGWRAVGDLGGVSFFLVCIHTAVMILLGFCFSNNAVFLRKEADKKSSSQSSSASQSYQPLDN